MALTAGVAALFNTYISIILDQGIISIHPVLHKSIVVDKVIVSWKCEIWNADTSALSDLDCLALGKFSTNGLDLYRVNASYLTIHFSREILKYNKFKLQFCVLTFMRIALIKE